MPMSELAGTIRALVYPLGGIAFGATIYVLIDAAGRLKHRRNFNRFAR